MSDKQTFMQKIDENIQLWRDQLEDLQKKGEKSADSGRQKLEEEMLKIRGKLNLAEHKTNELRQAGDESWQELKTGVERAWDEVEKALISSIEKFKN